MPTRPPTRCPTCKRLHPGLGKCPDCQARYEQARGTRQERGYDAAHQQLRAQWAPRVATGGVVCARGGHLIDPAKPWALDHTDDRTGYLGPSCATCNNRAGAIKRNSLSPK